MNLTSTFSHRRQKSSLPTSGHRTKAKTFSKLLRHLQLCLWWPFFSILSLVFQACWACILWPTWPISSWGQQSLLSVHGLISGEALTLFFSISLRFMLLNLILCIWAVFFRNIFLQYLPFSLHQILPNFLRHGLSAAFFSRLWDPY